MTTQVFVPPSPLQTAVLFLVFNRPDTTKQVFEAIRQAKPPRLYVAADGAREDKPGEVERVEQVRKIATQVDWPCKVETLFRDKNLGCKLAVSSAITWFFENEEQGIILEDDCLPSQSFFWFCEELLKRYKDDMRIFMVSGYNKQQEHDTNNDYFFSAVGGIWGWASWRRAWKYYNVDITNLVKSYEEEFYKLEFLLGKKIYKARVEHFNALKNGLDTWDYQWSFARHFNSGLSCVPKTSLIRNIGFGEDATHTTLGQDTVVMQDIKLPSQENKIVIADLIYDEKIHGKISIFERMMSKLKKEIHEILKK